MSSKKLVITTLTCIVFTVITLILIQQKEHNTDPENIAKFSFVNKSFHRDIKKSIRLYQSFEKHNTNNNDFFIVIPRSDYELFQNSFQKLKQSDRIKNLPKFITDEYIFEKCNINLTKKIPGYLGQQMVKMCFFAISNGDYMTIDSDAFFVKEIKIESFYKNNKLKTVYGRIKKPDFINRKIYPQQTFDSFKGINKYLKIDSLWITSYIAGAGLWSKNEMINLVDFMKKNYNMSIKDMIEKCPYEMQWYGSYVENYSDLYKYNASNFFIVDYQDRTVDEDFYNQECIVDKDILLIICQNCKDKKYEKNCNKKQKIIYLKSITKRFMKKLHLL
jgi:hypothetical protein